MKRFLGLMVLLGVLNAVGCVTTTLPVSGPGNGKVKVFLLSGQANTTGRGNLVSAVVELEKQKHTLFGFINKPKNAKKYAYLRSGTNLTDTGWAIRDDVFITMGEWPHLKEGEAGYNAYNRHGGLGPYYGGRGNRGFGPELAIGHILGNYYEDPVLLVKVSFGGNSLGRNFRPPSSGGELGDKYPKVVDAVRVAIEHLPDIIPGYDGNKGYELVGFFWNQGLSDAGEQYSAEYEQNLVNLINDLRKDLDEPDMKTVIGLTGNWGRGVKYLKESHAHYRKKHPDFTEEKSNERISWLQRVQQAQIYASKRPEFEGTVATAETRDFWRPRATYGGHGTEEHWMANGESYWLIGEAMALEMVDLLVRDRTEKQ